MNIIHPLPGYVFRDVTSVYLAILFPIGFFDRFRNNNKVSLVFCLNFGIYGFLVPLDIPSLSEHHSLMLTLPALPAGFYCLDASVVSEDANFLNGPFKTNFSVMSHGSNTSLTSKRESQQYYLSKLDPLNEWLLSGTVETSAVVIERHDISLINRLAFSTSLDCAVRSDVTISIWYCGCSRPKMDPVSWLDFALGGGGDESVCSCGCTAHKGCMGFPSWDDEDTWRQIQVLSDNRTKGNDTVNNGIHVSQGDDRIQLVLESVAAGAVLLKLHVPVGTRSCEALISDVGLWWEKEEAKRQSDATSYDELGAREEDHVWEHEAVNVALNKPVRMSSVSKGTVDAPGAAVDGIWWVTLDGPGPAGAAHAVSDVEQAPWLEIDLLADYEVSSISLLVSYATRHI